MPLASPRGRSARRGKASRGAASLASTYFTSPEDYVYLPPLAHFREGPPVPNSRLLVSAYISAAVLAGCGAGTALSPSPFTANGLQAAHHSRTFGYTGTYQYFQVPSGVRHVTITAWGASGGSGGASRGAGGRGGLVKATIPVNAGESLTISVGGEGASYSGGGGGGFNGGAPSAGGGGGGGGSDVREGGLRFVARVVVAGGGGGGGQGGIGSFGLGGRGGAGGGDTGAKGRAGQGSDSSPGQGGRGGAQSAGGSGGSGGSGDCDGNPGQSGKRHAGGDGGSGGDMGSACSQGAGGVGGGGGGGYYGGGGGGQGALFAKDKKGGAGGGGGGSSYVESTGQTLENTR